MQLPVTIDDELLGFYLAKMTANILGVVGTYPHQAECVCVPAWEQGTQLRRFCATMR